MDALPTPEQVVRSFVDAINRRRDDELFELMTADHVFVDSLGNQIAGRDPVRSGWKSYFRMVPDYSITCEDSLSAGQMVVLLGVASGTYSADGTMQPENRWVTPLAIRADVDHARLSRWQVFADNDPIRRLMQGHG